MGQDTSFRLNDFSFLPHIPPAFNNVVVVALILLLGLACGELFRRVLMLPRISGYVVRLAVEHQFDTRRRRCFARGHARVRRLRIGKGRRNRDAASEHARFDEETSTRCALCAQRVGRLSFIIVGNNRIQDGARAHAPRRRLGAGT